MVLTVNLGVAGLASVWNIPPRLVIDAPAPSLAGRIEAVDFMLPAGGCGSISARLAALPLVSRKRPTAQLGGELAQSLWATPADWR
jgi:hypothetical protein